jgi:hypothetical protein
MTHAQPLDSDLGRVRIGGGMRRHTIASCSDQCKPIRRYDAEPRSG